jgi:hypothetical protein
MSYRELVSARSLEVQSMAKFFNFVSPDNASWNRRRRVLSFELRTWQNTAMYARADLTDFTNVNY